MTRAALGPAIAGRYDVFMPTAGATRTSWEAKPLPELRTALPYARTFGADERVRLERGLVPDAMEDKWFIFYEAPWLFLHRSWTGICIYAVKLKEDGEAAAVEEAWVNRTVEQYREADDAYDAKMLSFLVDRLLLGLPAAFPTRQGASPDTRGALLVHHVVGHGRANDE